MRYRTIDVRPVAGALGAEITGVNLSTRLSNQIFDEIYQAFLNHKVIFFRDQKLTPHQQLAFGRLFGEPNVYPFVEGLSETPEIFEVLKTKTDQRNFGGVWHSDSTYLTEPPIATVLYAHEVPETGGDTMFTNTCLAYETLSNGLKQTLSTLNGVNSAALNYGGGRANLLKKNTKMKSQNLGEANQLQATHPVVRTIPETGCKALYVNKSHTVCFEGWTESESKPLIELLANHAVRPEFTCRFKWHTKSLAVWDNRTTQHFAINDYDGSRRRMHRMTIKGEMPV